SNSWRAHEVGHHNLAGFRREIHGPKSKTTIQTWTTFLNNHVFRLASVDFFAVNTVWFEILFVLSFSPTTDDASSTLMSQRIPRLNGRRSKCVKPFPSTQHPDNLLRDRDRIYGQEFCKQSKS